MSTEVHPPSTPPRSPTHSPTPRRASSTHPKRQKSAPPSAFTAGSSRRRTHGRSAPFAGFVSRMLPSHRPEQGHTLRERWDRTSSVSAADLVFGIPVEDVAGGDTEGGNAFVELVETRRGGEGAASVDRGGLTPEAKVKESRFREEWSVDGGEVVDVLERGDGNEERKGDDGKRTGWLFGLKRQGKEKVDSPLYVDPVRTQTAAHVAGTQLRLSLTATPKVHLMDRQLPQGFDAQQVFQGKESRRAQRRSLLDSGDFLGVQGANPRTGTWDISEATSSSNPSALSEETKRRLEQHAMEVEENKRRYEEVRVAQQTEFVKIHTLRDTRRKERSDQKRQEMKQRAKRYGKWKLNDNGWSSVAEPELSPIEQSAAGSPLRETSSEDRLFPMPSASNPSPYFSPNNIEQQDFFGRRDASSPLRQDRQSVAAEDAYAPAVPYGMTIRRKPVGSPPRRHQDESTATIIHGNIAPAAASGQSVEKSLNPLRYIEAQKNSNSLPLTANEKLISSTPMLPVPFLGHQRQPQPDPGGKAENKATVISSPLVSTKPAEIRHQLAQSLRPNTYGKVPPGLPTLPRILLKSPVEARVPTNSLPKGPPLVVWAPPTITENIPEFHAPITTTPTIITTGSDRLRLLPAQYDGPIDCKNGLRSFRAQLGCQPCMVPQRMSSLQKKSQNEPQRTEAPTIQADIGTSLATSLSPTRKQPNGSCLPASPKGGLATLRTIPTSTSTYPLSPVKQVAPAETAARMAFKRLNFPVARKSNAVQTFLPTLRRQKGERMKEYIEREFKSAISGQGGIGHPSKPDQIVKTTELNPRRSFTTPLLSGAVLQRKLLQKTGEDVLVCHPWPQTGSPKKSEISGQRPIAEQKTMQALKPEPGLNTKPSFHVNQKKSPTFGEAAGTVIQTVWWLVEPIFNPKSELRKRCDQRHLTWRDLCLFGIAAVFGVALFLIILACVRVVSMILAFLKGFLVFLKVWSGL